MAFDLFRNNRPRFRIRVAMPRVCRVNDYRSVLYISAELRVVRFGAMISKDFYFPTLLAVKEALHV
jgi:hypothetical protein